jgi:hypothetical protein
MFMEGPERRRQNPFYAFRSGPVTHVMVYPKLNMLLQTSASQGSTQEQMP